MTALLLLRHGKTLWNEEKRLQGQTDIDLSPGGIKAVENWQLPDECQDYQALTSPLIRARHTAKILSLDAKVEPRLTEMSWGAWEGQQFPDVRKRLGASWPAYQAKGLDFRPDGGESLREVQTRLLPWLRNIQQPTVAVTHKGIVQALHALATNWDMIGKPPIKFKDDCGHLFDVEKGRILINQMNIDLVVS